MSTKEAQIETLTLTQVWLPHYEIFYSMQHHSTSARKQQLA